MQTWSQAFRTYIEARFGEHPQQRASQSLKVAKSTVSYWARGASMPRHETLARIERWSKGEVPALLAYNVNE